METLQKENAILKREIARLERQNARYKEAFQHATDNCGVKEFMQNWYDEAEPYCHNHDTFCNEYCCQIYDCECLDCFVDYEVSDAERSRKVHRRI